MLISIIIPVYNAAKYLTECLNSIIKQRYTELEIILVDDGSSDGSDFIYNYFASKDSRIKIIQQKNRGVSVARQRGIEIAKGNWIIFVDADDTISENMCELIAKNSNNNDLIIFSKAINEKKILKDYEKVEFLKGALGYSNIESYNESYLATVWSKAYSNSLINSENCRFLKGLINGEDTLFNLKAFELAKHIYLVNESVYNFRLNPESATKKFQSTILDTDYLFLTELRKNIRLSKYSERLMEIYDLVVLNGLWVCLIHNIAHPDNKKFYSEKINDFIKILSNSIYKNSFCNWGKYKKDLSLSKKIVFHLIDYKFFKMIFCLFKLKNLSLKNEGEKIIEI